MFRLLGDAETAVQKRRNALLEHIDIGDYLNTRKLAVVPDPFPHVVADNFFKQEYYTELVKHFDDILNRGLSEGNDQAQFHPFLELQGEYAYDGYVYEPLPKEAKVLNLFFSVSWNLFFSKLFKVHTGYTTNLAYHYHPPYNKTGFVHHDHAKKWFSLSNRLPNGVIFRAREGAHRPGVQGPFSQEYRKIALIYYLKNDGWEKGDGGETGLYASKEGPPLVRVEPRNNRLLAFKISEKSFHAFQTNNIPRSSITQWFHNRT